MRFNPLLTSLAIAAAFPVFALDISGNVLDKQGNPIAAAKVCIKSDPTSCVTTDADGAFQLTKAIAVRKPGARDAGFTLAYRRGSLIVRSPAPVAARLEWLSADGRRAFSASEVRLAAGVNALPLPAGLPHAGLVILRLSTADRILTWKAMLATDASPQPGSPASATTRIASLAKAAAATLEISKSGYRTRLYDPYSETESYAIIYLSQTTDVGLAFNGSFTLKVASIDHAKKIVIVELPDVYCDSATNAVVHETVQDTQNYAVASGNLWTWYTGECTGQMFTGSASDIVGKWTLVDPNGLLPANLRGDCAPDTIGGGDSPFETIRGDYTISETQISGTKTGEMCPGDYMGGIFDYLYSVDSTTLTTQNTCKKIVYTNGKNETATFDFTKLGDSLRTAYAYKTSTCLMYLESGLVQNDPVCPEGEGLATFVACLSGSGFAKMGSLGKVSAAGTASLPMSLARRNYISRLWKAALPKK